MFSATNSGKSNTTIKFLVDDEVNHFIDKVKEFYQQKTPFASVQKSMEEEAQKVSKLTLTFLEIPANSSLYIKIYENTLILGQVIAWCFYYGSNSQDLDTRKSITSKSKSVVNASEILYVLMSDIISVSKRKIIVFSVLMAIAFVIFVIGCILLAISLIRFIVNHYNKPDHVKVDTKTSKGSLLIPPQFH